MSSKYMSAYNQMKEACNEQRAEEYRQKWFTANYEIGRLQGILLANGINPYKTERKGKIIKVDFTKQLTRIVL